MTDSKNFGGIDPITSSIIINAAKEDVNLGADLFKNLATERISNSSIEQSHLVYSALWYIPWAYITDVYSWRIWVIDNLNNSSRWMYDWIRYPIYANFWWWVYEYSIFLQQYNKIQKYANNPEQALEDFKDDIQVNILKDNKEDIEKMLETQNAMKQLSFDALCDFIDQNNFTNEYMNKYSLFLVKKQINNFLNKKDKTQNIGNVLFSLYEKHNTKTKAIIEKTIFDLWWISSLGTIYDHELFSVIAKDTQEYVIQTLTNVIQETDWEEIYKLYDSWKYWKKTKQIMRDYLETI